MQTARKALAIACLGAALALGAGRAAADTCCSGFYITGLAVGGGQFVYDIQSTGPITGAVNKDHTQDSGAGGGIAMGFDWKRLGAPIRTEIEFVHIIRYDYDRRPAFTNRLASAGFENNINSTTILLNVLYDFNIGSSWWRPFAGFSIGYARNASDFFWNDQSSATGIVNEETAAHSLAWGLNAGGNFDITPNWFAEAGYRFLNTGDLKAVSSVAGVKFESDTVIRHELRLGLGYRF